MKIKVTYINTNTKDPYEKLKEFSKDELISMIKDLDKTIDKYDRW